MKCWISDKLTPAIDYDTELVSGLFERRDSGGFPTFYFHLSFSVSDFRRLCLYKKPYCSCFFSDIFHFLSSYFFHLLNTNLFFSRALLLPYRSEYIDSPLFATQKLTLMSTVF